MVSANDNIYRAPASSIQSDVEELFTHDTRAFVYGMQPKAVQGMLVCFFSGEN